MLKKLSKRIAIIFIRFYQLLISPLLGYNCRYVPSCSSYAIDSIQEYGIINGINLTMRRIMKCHPLGGSGYDPVTAKGIKCNEEIILASSSVIRKQMLAKAGINAKTISPDIDEDKYKGKNLPLKEIALILSCEKAEKISNLYPQAIVIAADQICELDGVIFNKPGNKENAISQLSLLSGKTHLQQTANCIYKNGTAIWKNVTTSSLTMRELTIDEIEKYINLDTPYSSCGSYQFEAYGKHLFSKVEGDHDAILGLCLQPLLSFLHEQKIIELDTIKQIKNHGTK